MGTVASSAVVNATGFSPQRKIDRCQNGVPWTISVRADGAYPNALISAYSTDGGQTWTTGSPVDSQMSGNTYNTDGSLFIDLDDCAHVVYKHPTDGFIKYVRGTPNATRTAYTWSSPLVIYNTDAAFQTPDIVICRDPATAGAWTGLIVASRADSNTNKVRAFPLSISSAGAVSLGTPVAVSAPLAAANSTPPVASLDFNHTGDGKTVAGGTPHWYVAWSAGTYGAGYGIRFRKATYSGGTWTWGTEREIDNTFYAYYNSLAWLQCIFDGTRVVIGGFLYNTTYFLLRTWDRDAADTTTTAQIGSSSSVANDRQAGAMTHDAAGNLYLFGYDGSTGSSGSRAGGYRKWTRTTATLAPAVVLDPTTSDNPLFSVRRGTQGQTLDALYTDGTASPYTVTSARVSLNQAPNAPTLSGPADGATVDSSAPISLTFVHNDPDGDAATAWDVLYRPAGTTVAYAVLSGTTTAANGATITATVPTGTWAGPVQWTARTYDTSSTAGTLANPRTATAIPSGLAAATGGSGGTAYTALAVYGITQAERALRTAGRSVLAPVTQAAPLQITVDGATTTAQRNAGYSPAAGDTVQATLIGDTWVVQDKISS